MHRLRTELPPGTHIKPFFSVSRPTICFMNPGYPLTETKWLASLACKTTEQHLVIFVEGIRKCGQHFIERFHIVTSDFLVGSAMVDIQPRDPTLLDPNHYIQQFYPISAAEGLSLQASIQRQEGHPVPFSKVCGSVAGRYNCVTWAVGEFRKIGIKVDANAFTPPSCIVKKKQQSSSCVEKSDSCSVM
eukprot:TRINITY_DN34514_c0_g1_i1.p1 TRINITY_DN34514_c0_g1~~TRINITY_DN34514_c0_g1_i1.p1  ORF type:complete len:217 (-),score=17.96 TRINITY_DN34514_c0_g1_i1:51-614(-)